MMEIIKVTRENIDNEHICVISSPKKMAFLSDPKYLAYKGFEIADTAGTLIMAEISHGIRVGFFTEMCYNNSISLAD